VNGDDGCFHRLAHAIDITEAEALLRLPKRHQRFSYGDTPRSRIQNADKGRSPTMRQTTLLLASMQIVLPPELEDLVQQQLASGKYQSAIDVLLAGVKLLEQQEAIYQGRLQDLQQEARIGWEAAQRGELVDGATAMAQIRANLRDRHSSES